MGQLDGKVAIVTGASGVIGSACATLFAREGARVVAADVADDKGEAVVDAIRADGDEATYVHCDVSDSAEVDSMVATTVETYGPIGVLHTNPFWSSGAKIGEMTDENWHKTIAVTLDGVFYCSRAVVPSMLELGGGSMIHTSSVAGVVGLASTPAYCAAKGGVVQLSRAIARDYGRQGIRCNALCPGNVLAKERLPDTGGLLETMQRMSCLGRSASGEEMATAAAFLASDASSCVTGSALMVDGGWTTL